LLWLIQHVEVTTEVTTMVDIRITVDAGTDMGTAVGITDMAITDIISRCIHSLV
jgi:hypothetical protein